MSFQTPLLNSAGIDNIKLSGRTAAMSNGDFSASPIGVDPFETDFTLFDDIDDYNNVDLNLTVFVNEETTANRGEYIDQTYYY